MISVASRQIRVDAQIPIVPAVLGRVIEVLIKYNVAHLSELFGSGTLTYFTVTPFGIQATIADSDITDAGSLKAEDNDF